MPTLAHNPKEALQTKVNEIKGRDKKSNTTYEIKGREKEAKIGN